MAALFCECIMCLWQDCREDACFGSRIFTNVTCGLAEPNERICFAVRCFAPSSQLKPKQYYRNAHICFPHIYIYLVRILLQVCTFPFVSKLTLNLALRRGLPSTWRISTRITPTETFFQLHPINARNRIFACVRTQRISDTNEPSNCMAHVTTGWLPYARIRLFISKLRTEPIRTDTKTQKKNLRALPFRIEYEAIFIKNGY